MDQDFYNLLTRYVDGNCTEAEVEKVNQWYEKIADSELELSEKDQLLVKASMVANLQKVLNHPSKPRISKRYVILRPLFKVAAAISVLAVCSLWYRTEPFTLGNSHETVSIAPGEVLYENHTADDLMYILPDGSVVQLWPSGELRFNENFTAGERSVYLTGKAFFDIVKDPSRPFYVYSGEVATRVLGTSFLVDAPVHGAKVEVKVITGKVSVFQVRAQRFSKEKKGTAIKRSDPNGVVLSPNQRVEYFIEGGHWVTGLVEEPVPVKSIDDQAFSFVFENSTIKDVLADINERYDIEVMTENEKIFDCTFTGDVSKMPLYDMLDVICNAIGATYEIKGTRILLSGSGCY